MVLVSFVLVVVAAITLVIGLLQSGLGIIYVSIGCSVLAGIVLATAVLRGRPEPRVAGAPSQAGGGAQPAPAPNTWVSPDPTPAAPLPSSPAPQPVTAGTSAGALGDGGVALAERDDRTESLDRVESDEFAPDDDFAIHDYDRLRVTEILPMLAELSDDQLEAVDERERSGKNRAMVLNRIEAQKQSRASEAWDVDDVGWDAAAEAAPEPSRPEPSRPEPAVRSGSESGSRQGPMAQAPAAATAAVGEFPIPDFDDLKALEVLGRLPDLTVSELHLVRRREEDGFRRAMVLNRVDRLIEEAPPEPEPVVVAPRRRSTTRATSVKASAKRTVATKSAAAKGARGAATAATARKRTSATKAAAPVAKKATASTRKASATTRKAVAETRSATAKKAASTRKAAPARRPTKKR